MLDPKKDLKEAYKHIETAVKSLDNPSRKLKKAVNEAGKSIEKLESRTK